MHPVIGIPAVARSKSASEYAVRASYCEALTAAGGVPLLVPPASEPLLCAAYRRLDGLLLAGGGDVAPERYGAANSGKVKFVNAERDALELTLTRWALADGLPILAICRGIQLLNVAAGGSLLQDIPSDVAGALAHQDDEPAPHRAHAMEVTAGSRLATIYADGHDGSAPLVIGVNSRHHQAIDRLAEGFRVTARAADGIIEAIEPADAADRFVLGVQWHPEDLAPHDAATRALFAAYCAACAAQPAIRRCTDA